MTDTSNLYDVVVIGGGPAGLTAGLYLARARYRVLVLEKDDFGGQITITNEVVNYPGVGRTTGRALTQTMRQQARDFGAEFLSAEATGLDVNGDIKTVHTSRGDLRTFGIVLATGASPRRLGFEGEAEYAGRGVAYCATCDGEFFTGREVLVIGGGFAAAEESVFLTKYASKVTVLVREPDFTCDASVAAEAKKNPKIDVRYNTVLDGVTAGQGGLREATIRNVSTGETETWKPADDGTFGVFVFAGYVPATDLVRGIVELDDHGYVVTHGYLETSVPGVYAAGDLRVKNLRQVVTATADGAIAAVELERYAKSMSEKTGLVPPRPTTSAYEQAEAAAAANVSAAANAGTTPAPAPVKRSADAAAAAVQTAKKPGELFSAAIKQQLGVVFGRMTRPVTLVLELDDTPLSAELQGFIGEMVALSGGKLNSVAIDAAGLVSAVDGESVPTSLVVGEPATIVLPDDSGTELPVYGSLDESGRAEFDPAGLLPVARPAVRLCAWDESAERLTFTGLAFHGVPSGHEFNSFVLGLYNAAGPGQPLDDDLRERAVAASPTDIMILVSLTCTMCPETVLASQRIASLNPGVRAEAYDISHFPELKDQYGAMSVPCIVINQGGEQKVEFGKKSVPQMLSLIGA
ncbi:thioredoxin reductase [Bifidobacterium ramosum]|uniref:FAD-dependent oxidoreductase n=1 Tax=Bifidobacterium ramosum TaxID=1798158 RepID=A0A6L4WYX8_9BIFI|nr:FAD-dependent oxidoreductase [Bifidobacterium ramosum]KAB8287337.1 thioredoxin reductase [Bifidobacterium ramosum]NEG72394.1 FAD-dependent oxidoreductase [Bifidobacterium ramosum]